MQTATVNRWPSHVVGYWTLTSSLVHGGDEVLGTTRLFRTKGWIYGGRKIDIPMVSGNAVRGIWRRHCARVFLDAYLSEGGDPITLSAFHALTSGGSLTKSDTTRALSMEAAADLRSLVPYLGVFGASCLGRIQEGKLYVDEAIPVCRETVDRLGALWPDVRDQDTADVSIRELTEVHGYSRQDDSKSEWWRQYLAAPDRADLEAALQLQESSEVANAPGISQQMRYENMELVAGAVLFHRWGFRWPPTDDEIAGFGAGLVRWAERPAVGGRNAVGHGNLIPQYHGVSPETRLLGDGSSPLKNFTDTPMEELVRNHVSGHMDAISELLGVL